MSDDFDRARSERERDGSPPRRDAGGRPLRGIPSTMGNRNFARTVARMRDGDGILSGGVVHPDVEAAIASARGSGTAADRTVARRVGGALGDSLSDVRVHTDARAAALARSVAARAFTVGREIFFAPGEYRPSTPSGRELLAHELVHAVQQRGASGGGRLTVSEPGDALEREAEDVAREI